MEKITLVSNQARKSDNMDYAMSVTIRSAVINSAITLTSSQIKRIKARFGHYDVCIHRINGYKVCPLDYMIYF